MLLYRCLNRDGLGGSTDPDRILDQSVKAPGFGPIKNKGSHNAFSDYVNLGLGCGGGLT